MNIEEMSRDEPVFAEGSLCGSRRRAREIDMGDECLRRSMNAYVERNPRKGEFDRRMAFSMICFMLGTALLVYDHKVGLLLVWLAYVYLGVLYLDS